MKQIQNAITSIIYFPFWFLKKFFSDPFFLFRMPFFFFNPFKEYYDELKESTIDGYVVINGNPFSFSKTTKKPIKSTSSLDIMKSKPEEEEKEIDNILNQNKILNSKKIQLPEEEKTKLLEELKSDIKEEISKLREEIKKTSIDNNNKQPVETIQYKQFGSPEYIYNQEQVKEAWANYYKYQEDMYDINIAKKQKDAEKQNETEKKITSDKPQMKEESTNNIKDIPNLKALTLDELVDYTVASKLKKYKIKKYKKNI